MNISLYWATNPPTWLITSVNITYVLKPSCRNTHWKRFRRYCLHKLQRRISHCYHTRLSVQPQPSLFHVKPCCSNKIMEYFRLTYYCLTTCQWRLDDCNSTFLRMNTFTYAHTSVTPTFNKWSISTCWKLMRSVDQSLEYKTHSNDENSLCSCYYDYRSVIKFTFSNLGRRSVYSRGRGVR